MSNFIIEFQNALSADFCDSLINKFESDPNKHLGRTGAGVDSAKKDSLDLAISQLPDWQNENQLISQAITRGMLAYVRQFPMMLTGAVSPGYRDSQTGQQKTFGYQDIAQLSDEQLLGIINAIYQLDMINMQKYTAGQGGYHHWHSEHYPHPTDQSQKSLRRVLLWLLYLNDIQAGGETEFFYQQAKIKPRQGSLIIAPCNFTHTHRGCVPVSSDKYVLASWLMYHSAENIYST